MVAEVVEASSGDAESDDDADDDDNEGVTSSFIFASSGGNKFISGSNSIRIILACSCEFSSIKSFISGMARSKGSVSFCDSGSSGLLLGLKNISACFLGSGSFIATFSVEFTGFSCFWASGGSWGGGSGGSDGSDHHKSSEFHF